MMRTPGMTGWPGKCPLKCGSLRLTFLRATMRSSPISSTASTSRNGYRCGRIRSMSLVSSTGLVCRLLGGRLLRRGGLALGALARVVAADEVVREVEARLGEHDAPGRLVEDHREVLGQGDLAEDLVHPLE